MDGLFPATVAMLTCLLTASACSQSSTSASPVISWTTEMAAEIPVPTTEAGASALLVTAAWGGPGQLRIVTWGSSGCPELPDSVHGTAHTITVTTKALNPSGGGCTGDAGGRDLDGRGARRGRSDEVGGDHGQWHHDHFAGSLRSATRRLLRTGGGSV